MPAKARAPGFAGRAASLAAAATGWGGYFRDLAVFLGGKTGEAVLALICGGAHFAIDATAFGR
jgi:hypothetical protein